MNPARCEKDILNLASRFLLTKGRDNVCSLAGGGLSVFDWN